MGGMGEGREVQEGRDIYTYIYIFRRLYIYRLITLLSEKAMATHSSTLAWKIPWTEEPGRLQTTGSLRTQLSDFTFTFHFHALERKWQPTPVFLPGESQGQQSLAHCRLWGDRQSDTSEAT